MRVSIEPLNGYSLCNVVWLCFLCRCHHSARTTKRIAQTVSGCCLLTHALSTYVVFSIEKKISEFSISLKFYCFGSGVCVSFFLRVKFFVYFDALFKVF